MKRFPGKITESDQIFLYDTFTRLKFFQRLLKEKRFKTQAGEIEFIMSVIKSITLEEFQHGDPIISYGKQP